MAFIYDLTDTWNAGGTTFNAIKMNVTDTASAAASRLVSLQVGGVERFGVRKDGQGYFAGNVGIGTSSPGAALDIDGGGFFQISSSGTSRAKFFADASLTYLTSEGARPLTLSTNSAERMRIDSSGNVGIGLTNPSVRMEIVGASGFNPATQNTYAMWIANSGSANGDLAFGSSTTAAHIQSFNAKPLILNSAGNNVGIGTSSPSQRLHVSGAQITVPTAGWTSGQVAYSYLGDTNNGISATNGGNTDIFGFNGVTFSSTGFGGEKMRIDSSGNLLVGTTTSVSGERFTAQVSGVVNCIVAHNPTSATSGHTLFYGRADGADRFYVLGNGDVQNANNSYGAISDVKLKENVVDATPKLDKLMGVRVVNYNLKNDPGLKQLGVVAQELETVFPGMVEEIPDRDAEGGLTGETTKSVKYSVFVPMLIKALQEANEKIDTLAARVAQLEGK
jgi:hypothetical protein